MLIGHFSDNHGVLSILREALIIPDMWISTGDFFPNAWPLRPDFQIQFQNQWFDEKKNEIIQLLKGKPIICVGGNHDWADLGWRLKLEGYPAETLDFGKVVELNGIKFGGFKGVPPINGMWCDELEQSVLKEKYMKILDENPQVLVTHAPPGNILAHVGGINGLDAHLCYRTDLNIRLHCYGHIHEYGGQHIEYNNKLFVNSATTLQFIEYNDTEVKILEC